MKRNKILTLILGIAILSGIICSGMVIAQGIQTGNKQIHNIASNKKQTHRVPWKLKKTKLEEFSEISVFLSYCNFTILPSDDYYLEYRMDGSCEKPKYDISNGKFQFQEGQPLSAFNTGFHFFFNFGNPSSNQGPFYVNLYVPSEQYFDRFTLSSESGNAEIDTIQTKKADITIDYGNLDLENFTGKNLSIKAESGNIEMGSVTCDTLDVTDEYGNFSGGDFKISQKATWKLESGNLELSKLKTGHLSLSDDYGNCSIDETILKSSDISMESGNLTLKKAILGTTNINSSYGDIDLRLASPVTDYNYNLNLEYGSLNMDRKEIETDEDGEIHYRKDNKQENEINISSESGNVTIQ